jgi:hypothetical protein
LLFDLVVHQQQHLHCFWQHSNSFGGDFTKRNFYFIKQFMSTRNFYFGTEGVIHEGLFYDNLTTETNLETRFRMVV